MDLNKIKSVLILEDDESTCMVLSDILKTAGAKVTICKEMEQAVEALVSADFDVMITDFRMLGADVQLGAEFLSFIRKNVCREIVVMRDEGDNWLEEEICRRRYLKYIHRESLVKEIGAGRLCCR